MTLRFAPALVLLASVAAPLHAADEAEKPLTYVDDVLPILRANCVGCHNNDKMEGGLNMVQFAALMQGGGSGEVVSAGDGEFSYLYMLASHASEPVMPPNGSKMAEADLAILKKWIDTGARENAGSKVKMKPKEDLSLGAAPIGRPEGPPPMPPNPYDAAAYAEGAPAPMNTEALPVEGRSPGARPDAVVAMAASPWAPLVAVGGEEQVTLFHAQTLQPLAVLPFPEGRPQSLKFSTNGRLLIAGGGRGAYRGLAVVWDVTDGRRVAEIGEEPDAVLSADVSPDQSKVAIGTTSKRVKVYAVATGELLYTIDKPTDWVLSVAFSPDGVLLAVGDRSAGLSLWEAQSGLLYEDLRGHQDAVTDLSWRADSNLLASASLDDTVHLWKPQDGSLVRKVDVKEKGVESVAFAADGNFVTAGRSGDSALWDLNGKELRKFPARPDYALSAAIADEAVPGADGKPAARIFVGDWTGTVAVFDPTSDQLIAEFSPVPAPLADRLAAAEAKVKEAAAAAEAVAKRKADAAESLKKAEEAKSAAAKRVDELNREQDAAKKAQKSLSDELNKAKQAQSQAEKAAGQAQKAAEQAKQAEAKAAEQAKQAEKKAAEAKDEQKDAANKAAEEAKKAAEEARQAAAKAAEEAKKAADSKTAADAAMKKTAEELSKTDAALKGFPKQIDDAKKAAEAAAKAVEPAANQKKEADALADLTPARQAAEAELAGLKILSQHAAATPKQN